LCLSGDSHGRTLEFCLSFMVRYCRLSVLLDLEFLLAQQALREAFSDSELAAARLKHQSMLDFMQQAEELWRERRWIMTVLQHGRFKQAGAGLPLRMLLAAPCASLQPDPMLSSSSHTDFLASSLLSPDLLRRNTFNDLQGTSDEEGLSEVFLPADSDYESSCAQSPRELDLICIQTAGSASSSGRDKITDGLQDPSVPDVLCVASHDASFSQSPHHCRTAWSGECSSSPGENVRPLEQLLSELRLAELERSYHKSLRLTSETEPITRDQARPARHHAGKESVESNGSEGRRGATVDKKNPRKDSDLHEAVHHDPTSSDECSDTWYISVQVAGCGQESDGTTVQVNHYFQCNHLI
uniref:Uncharacterized protein n=1 Tax=Eptatretus burgeri TaxID=7764 RepID=A0A8C4X0P1_EPTBU